MLYTLNDLLYGIYLIGTQNFYFFRCLNYHVLSEHLCDVLMVEEICCKGIYFVDVLIVEVSPRKGELEIFCARGVVVRMVTITNDKNLNVVEQT